MWLLIRVALQTSLYRETRTHTEYKTFMAFFMDRLLRLALLTELPSNILFCLRAKVASRLYKLGSDAPSFLQRDVLNTTMKVEALLRTRWSAVQKEQGTPRSRVWSPETLKVDADTLCM